MKLVQALLLGVASAKPMTYIYKTQLDHFDSVEGDQHKFEMRYIVDDQYFKDPANENKTRPILFYTGNEGDIWKFYENSGFVTDTVAQEFGGLVVFGEHRYFGESYPFSKPDAFNATNNKYLTVEQTLLDYVGLLKEVKTRWNATDSATISFGGSYGGMLAAWMRMKYPHVIQGAVAASAPVLLFKDSKDVSIDAYGDQVTKVFHDVKFTDVDDNRCSYWIREALNLFDGDSASDPAVQALVTKTFGTCDTVSSAADMTSMLNSLQSGLQYMAMINYPYETEFLMPVPANPVDYACHQAYDDAPKGAHPGDEDLLNRLKKVADVYFNYKKQ